MVNENKTVDCERCGCNDTRMVETYLGQSTYECNHCRHQTIDGIDPYEEISTEYVTILCPICESDNTTITRGPQADKHGRFKRFHKCGNCRNPFASYEDRSKKKGRKQKERLSD